MKIRTVLTHVETKFHTMQGSAPCGSELIATLRGVVPGTAMVMIKIHDPGPGEAEELDRLIRSSAILELSLDPVEE